MVIRGAFDADTAAVLRAYGRAIGWLTAGSPRHDHGIDMVEEVDQFDREERCTDQRQHLRPAVRSYGRPSATG